MKYIIIGVAGGASTAARLRRLDENASIILFEKDAHISYANCGLPHYIGPFEHAYAPPYSSTKDPVNMPGFVAENIPQKRLSIARLD